MHGKVFSALALIIFLFYPNKVYSENLDFMVLPVFFSSSDVGAAFGLQTITLFDHNESSYYFLGGAVVSTKSQKSYYFDISKTNSSEIKTDIVFRYRDWPQNYFGIGMNSNFDDKTLMHHKSLTVDVTRKYYSGSYFWGPAIAIDHADISLEGRSIETINEPSPSGIFSAGGGFTFGYDTRDQPHNTDDGVLMSIKSIYFISNDDYNTMTFINIQAVLAYYTSLQSIHGFRFHYLADMHLGTTPFQRYHSLGSAYRMRGYQQNRFLDKNLMALQGEYVWKYFSRIQPLLFVGYGTVYNELEEVSLNEFGISAGGGIRIIINKKTGFRVCLDYAITREPSDEENWAFYIRLAEAF